ncbi:hypothetical protein EP227_01735 [bacterium]|nr:MAG: hypothetical protein EP227_01735 [bacterium]
MDILNGVIKKSLFIIIPAVVIAALSDSKKLPLGIIAGTALGILNFRGLVRSVEGFVGSEGLTAKILFMSMFRLVLLFAAIAILMWLKIINVFGLIFGFTVVFIFILLEGFRVAKKG